jgi:anti-anti-sigma factor
MTLRSRESTLLVTSPPPLELRSSYLSGALVVDAEGEVDLATAPQLAAALGAVSESTTRVVLDLSAVSFLDSSGLNALVHARRELARRQVTFRVVSPRDQVVRRVFEITQLDDELGVVESLDAALA